MAAPLLTRITPFEIPTGATTAMTLAGTGLTGATLQVPSGTLASSIVITDTQITFNLQVPAGKSDAPRRVSVATAAGESNVIPLNYMGSAETPYPFDPGHTGA